MRYISVFIFLTIQVTTFSQDIVPITGKWNLSPQGGYANDYIGIWKNSHRRGYLDATGNGTVNGVTADMGNLGDVPLTMNYIGDERDEIVLFRPSTRQFIFYSDFSFSSSHHFTTDQGDSNDVPLTGDWDGDGKDGFALYRSSTRQIIYFQNYDSPEHFYVKQLTPSNSIPLIGNWDGRGSDGYALFNSTTRTIEFFQNIGDTEPFFSRDYGDIGDQVIIGDWNGTGTDDVGLFRQLSTPSIYLFIFYESITGTVSAVSQWTDKSVYAYDISDGRKVFYTNKVPHIGFDCAILETYNPQNSFIPKGIYAAPPEKATMLYKAGYNLSILLAQHYPLKQQNKVALDSTANNFRFILPMLKIGGVPFVGKFNGTSDLVGIGSTDSRLIYFDSNGDHQPDRQIDPGDRGDIPFSGDWNADGIDELALFRHTDTEQKVIYYSSDAVPGILSTVQLPADAEHGRPISGNWNGIGTDEYAIYRRDIHRIYFYDNKDATTPNVTRDFPNISFDNVIAGDWDGDGVDGFALYNALTRNLIFYQNLNSPFPFLTKDIGDPGDIPIAGDWNNDGMDGVGIYRTDTYHSFNTFALFNNIESFSSGASMVTFESPLIEDDLKKYVLGIYTFDEPTVRTITERQNIYDAMTNIYGSFGPLTSQILFHTDNQFTTLDDNAIDNEWWKTFSKVGDVTSHDDYAFRENNTATSPSLADEVRNISSVANTIENARVETNENKPNWYTSQAFSDPSGTKEVFKPTPSQYRATIYTSIIHGATGFFTFAYQAPSPVVGLSSYGDLWDESVRINDELDELKPYILSKTSNQQYSIYSKQNPFFYTESWDNEAAPIRGLLKYFNDHYVLFTVNLTKEPIDVIIQLPYAISPTDGVIDRMFEETSTSIKAGAINDVFAPFGVHIYKFRPSAFPAGRVGVGNTKKNNLPEKIPSVDVYPNPSSSTITFDVSLGQVSNVTILIYDMQGRLVKRVDAKKPAENYTFVWEQLNGNQEQFQYGLYFYKVYANNTLIGKGRVVVEK